MPNYNDKSVLITYAGGGFVLPDPYSFYSNDREIALREFIFILRYFKNKVNNVGYIPGFPYQTLYNEVFEHLVHTHPSDSNVFVIDQTVSSPVPKSLPSSSSSITDYTEVLPNLIYPLRFDPCLTDTPNPGLVAEAMILFAHYYLIRSLAFDTIYSLDILKETLIHVDVPQTNNADIVKLFKKASFADITAIADIPVGSKSIVYQALYSVLTQDTITGEGFIPIESLPTLKKIAFNEMLDIRAHIGKYNSSMSFSSSSVGALLPNGEIPISAVTLDTISPLARNLYMQMYLSYVSGGPADKVYSYAIPPSGPLINKRPQVLRKVREVIQNKIGAVSQQLMEYEVKGIWSQLFPRKAPPTFQIAATGDGSTTNGLFNSPNLGAIFFQYDYGSPLSNLNYQKTIRINRAPHSSILLKTYGAQASTDYFPTTLNLSYKQLINGVRVTIDLKFSINLSDMIISAPISTTLRLADPSIPNPNIKELIAKVPYPESAGDLDVYNNIPPGQPAEITIARWHKDIGELEILNDQAFEITVTQTSGLKRVAPIDRDELQSVISVVPNPYFSPLYISASDLYRNDKFFMTKQRISKLLSTERELAGVDQIIDLIVNENATFEVLGLYGKFVGTPNTEPIAYGVPSVIPDVRYIPHDDSIEFETGIDPPEYDPLRYSFASIDIDRSNCANPKIQLKIDSFVSPRYSGLKDRMDGVDPDGYDNDYRNYTIPVTSPSLPPAPSPDGSILDDNFTNSYTISAFGKKSYNQPLAMLRSIGLLEGIAYKIRFRALERYKSVVSPDYLVVLDALSIMMNSAEALDYTAESRGFTSVTNPPEYTTSGPLYGEIKMINPISFYWFQQFKWYALKSIKRLISDSGDPDKNSSGHVQDLVKPNGEQVYEYFDYPHENWND